MWFFWVWVRVCACVFACFCFAVWIDGIISMCLGVHQGLFSVLIRGDFNQYRTFVFMYSCVCDSFFFSLCLAGTASVLHDTFRSYNVTLEKNPKEIGRSFGEQTKRSKCTCFLYFMLLFCASVLLDFAFFVLCCLGRWRFLFVCFCICGDWLPLFLFSIYFIYSFCCCFFPFFLFHHLFCALLVCFFFA